MNALATIARHYQHQLIQKYAKQMKNVHHSALKQIIACHTPQAGAMLYHCDDCQTDTTLYPSCGHRHCPACQHKSNSDWLALQQQKLLPVDYYLVTFTLPYQCRSFVWLLQPSFSSLCSSILANLLHQRIIYSRRGNVTVTVWHIY